jgi:hypothetical protein
MKYSWFSFVLEDESTPGPWCGQNDYINEKFQRHNQESNLRACSAVLQPTAPPPAPREMDRTPVYLELLLKQWSQYLPRHICPCLPLHRDPGNSRDSCMCKYGIAKNCRFFKHIYSGPSSYDRLDIRTIWVTTNFDIRPKSWVTTGAQIRVFVDVIPVSALLYIINFDNCYQNCPQKARK